MWECDYAREPIDYRLFGLRLLKKIWILPLAALIGFVVIGGIYYMSKLCFGNGRTYQAETMYYIDFAVNPDGEEYTYLNQYTWGQVIKTDFFTDMVYEKLGGAVSKEDLEASVYAGVESDTRYLYTRYTSRDKELSLKVEKVYEEAVAAFGEAQKEFNEIRVVNAPLEAKDVSNIRLLTAAILGAVVGFVTAVILMLVRAVTDTSVYIPATLEKRYRVPALGAPSMAEYEENCKVMLGGCDKVYAVPGDDKTDISGLELYVNHIKCANPVADTSEISKLKDASNVVVAVKAGAHNGKRLERTLEELGRISAKVTAFALIGEDEKLIKSYYKK